MTDRAGVVVVSADAGTRSHVRLTLGDARFVVDEAEDAAGAINLIASRAPALVIVDLDLPGVGGTALARSLRAQPETSAVRTLVLVPRGGAVPEDASGVDATLRVPATSFALLYKVDAVLDARTDG